MPRQDYEHTYYPTSLPLRPPYSGDPGMASHYLDPSERMEQVNRDKNEHPRIMIL